MGDHILNISIPNPTEELRTFLFDALNNYGLDTYSFNLFKTEDENDKQPGDVEFVTWPEKQEGYAATFDGEKIVKPMTRAEAEEYNSPALEPDPQTDADLLELISDALSKLGPQSVQAYDSRNREQRFVLSGGKLYRWCQYCGRTHAL